MSQTQSPFQFLAPYSADKKDSFLGRDQEIEKLYELTFATNLIMVYGSSGTGKTSLVQSGLSKKLSGPDWIPLFIRRGDNFKASLTNQLKVISKVQKEDTSVSEHLAVINRRYYRPVYLFFDQFEEVFTLSDKQQSYKKELKELFETLNELQSENTCKIILIIREEFLGLLYESEQYLPNLFDFRLRVEPMSKGKIKEVVSGIFQEFKIQTEPLTLTTTISEKLVEGQANGQLAYLQVYLEKLWREATAIESTNSTVIIKQQHVDTIKDIQNVLDTYLNEQQKNICTAVNVEEKVIKELLDLFVTDDSTKRPRTFVSLQKEIKGGLTEVKLQEILKQLETARLLILEKENYELAHDTLAKVIDSKRQGRDLLIKNLKNTLKYNRENQIEIDRVVLKQYDELKQDADFDEETQQYVQHNRTRIKRNSIFRGIAMGLFVALFICIIILFIKAQQESKRATTSLLAKESAELRKEILEDKIMLRRINDILDNQINNPSKPMLDSLALMRSKLKSNQGYQKALKGDIESTFSRIKMKKIN